MTDISPGYGVTFVGPFVEEHRVVVDGRCLPHLTAHPSKDGDLIYLSLDHRFGIEGTPEEVAKWVQFIGNCMAVAAGYSHLGAEKKHEIFAVPMSALAPPKPTLTVVPPSLPEHRFSPYFSPDLCAHCGADHGPNIMCPHLAPTAGDI